MILVRGGSYRRIKARTGKTRRRGGMSMIGDTMNQQFPIRAAAHECWSRCREGASRISNRSGKETVDTVNRSHGSASTRLVMFWRAGGLSILNGLKAAEKDSRTPRRFATSSALGVDEKVSRFVKAPGSQPSLVVIFVALFLLSGQLFTNAADVEPKTFWNRVEEKGVFERIWEKLRFYENEDNDIIQAFSMIGRYHGQYWSVNANQGSADAWENRRVYLGAEALLFHHVTVQAQIKVSEDFAPFYDGLYQAFVKWSPVKEFSMAVGQLDFLFAGFERSISSTKISTFERGLLANQLLPSEVVGAVVEGKPGDFFYRAGVFSGSIEDEFTEFKGGFGAVAGVGYKLPLFYETGTLHLDYLFNNGNSANNALHPYDHVVSLWHQGQAGPFGLGFDLTCAHGLQDRPFVFGLTVLPTYTFAKDVIRKGDAFQAALRYQFGISDGDNGLQLQKRYEQEVAPSGFGDRYQAIYAGINYLIFGDRLKLMTGAEYSMMRDAAHDGGRYDGWTYMAGVRVYF